MKFNFRKISAIAASAIMFGMTVGVAAAASFPAPFSSSTSAGVAVVTGTGTGVDDLTARSSIADYLATQVITTGGVPTGGDSYKFEKISTKYHLGDNITDVISTAIDEDEMPNLLADGIYVDDDNDEFDYTQKITIGDDLQLTMFEDNDYKEDVPTVGFRIPSSTTSTVLTYMLSFSDEPLMEDLVSSDLMFMGKDYYVLTQAAGGDGIVLTLLDSAQDTIVAEEETATVEVEGTSYSVSITYISASEVKLSINGETTNSLEESETQKLSDGSYVGIKDIMHDSKTDRLSSVEFSIGSGKLKLTSGSEIQMNDDTISGLEANIVNSTTTLTSIALVWYPDDDLFIAEDSEITMPGFEAVKLSFGGLDYPLEETIEVEQGGDLYAVLEDFPLKDGAADINILYGTTGGDFLGLGKDANNVLVTAAAGANLTYDKNTDDYFVVSWSDTNDAESYLCRFTNFVLDSTTNKTDFQYYKNGVWTDKKTGLKALDTFSVGSVDLKLWVVNRAAKTALIGNNSAYTNFNTLYSKEGMTVYLPYVLAADNSSAPGAIDWDNNTAGHNATSFHLVMREEDKNGNKAHADGHQINLTIGWDGSTPPEPEVTAIVTTATDAAITEIGDTDVWRDFTYSALATEILFDKPSSGQKSAKIIYHGDEVAANVYINSPETVMGGGEVGSMVFTDAEQTSWQSRDVILVGGSCINSATATALGVTYPTCEAAFTTATGVGSGQYLIQSIAGSSGGVVDSGKIALVVAGYSKADTTAAASRLVNQPTTIDTTAGNKYLGIVGATGTSTITKVV